MSHRLMLNETSYHGSGAVKNLVPEIKARGLGKALVVTDPGLVKAGVTAMATCLLDEAGLPYEIFSDVKPNPTVENVRAGVEAYRAAGADYIIAVGGGSPMDTAKAIGIIAANPEYGDVRSLDDLAHTKNPSVPLIAIATTAGSASEVSLYYVISDDERRKKIVCIDTHCLPVVAIVDPDLMATLPKRATAEIGMDALTHAIECYITRDGWEVTDMFSLKAVEIIYKSIRGAYEGTREGREGMALGQYLAGMGFSNSGVGMVHSLSGALSGYYDTPHGFANAILLPSVLEYNAPYTGEKYRDIAKAMGIEGVDEMTQDEYRAAVVEAVRRLARDLGIPQDLKGIARPEDVQGLAETAYGDPCTLANPVTPTVEDMAAIYRSLL